MYKIGDKLVHPSYGAGELKSIEQIVNSYGMDASKKEYYVLEMFLNGERIMVPVENADAVGIRPIIKKEDVQSIVELLDSKPDMTVDNWTKRHHDNLEKIKSGDVYALTEVIRDLYYRNVAKGLSSRERKMLINAKRILLSELSVVMGEDYKALEEKLRSHFINEIEE